MYNLKVVEANKMGVSKLIIKKINFIKFKKALIFQGFFFIFIKKLPYECKSKIKLHFVFRYRNGT